MMPLKDMTNIHCWLSAIRGMGIIDHSFSIEDLSFGINCTSCSSPQFDELILSLYDFGNTSEAISTIQDQTESLLDIDFVQAYLNYAIDDSARKCPHRPEFDPDLENQFLLSAEETGSLFQIEAVQKPVYSTVINSMIAGLIFTVGVVCRCIINRRNRIWTESLDNYGQVQLELQQNKEKQMVEMLNKLTDSLFRSDCIPKRVRYGVPLVLALNLGLLLGAHLAVISTVDLEASIAGEDFTVNTFMEFTFLESTKNAYQSGGAEMIVLLWVFTVIWPYIKLCLSLLMWMAPPNRLSVTNRGKILLWIDAAAKLSVIDIFTVIVGVALLLVFIGGPDESYSQDDNMLYSMKAVIVPGGAFYCMIISQRISRVSSRFFLEYHNHVVKHAAKVIECEEHSAVVYGNDGAASTCSFI